MQLLTLSRKVRLYLHLYVWKNIQRCLALVAVSSSERVLLLVVEPSSCRQLAWLLIAHCSSYSFSNIHAHDHSSRCSRIGFRGFQQFTRFCQTPNSIGQRSEASPTTNLISLDKWAYTTGGRTFTSDIKNQNISLFFLQMINFFCIFELP